MVYGEITLHDFLLSAAVGINQAAELPLDRSKLVKLTQLGLQGYDAGGQSGTVYQNIAFGFLSLKMSGWPSDQIAAAYAYYYEIIHGEPPP